MTSYSLHWPEGTQMVKYTSTLTLESRLYPGVRFTICRLSFGRRLELIRRIGDLVRKLECLESSERDSDRVEAALLRGEIERAYFMWGLESVEGIEIDGQPATAEVLVERGPEDLVREIVEAIKTEAGLSEEERKN